MRSIVIAINCDACKEEIEEEVEGASAITFSVRGEKREMDICDTCLGMSFLQEARPVTDRRKSKKQKPEKPFACGCGRSFETERGLGQHLLRAAHE